LKQEIQKSLAELIYLGIEKNELIELIESTYEAVKGGRKND